MQGLSVTTPPRSEWFPIGSIYINVNTTNPGTIFGGTWEQIKDKFLLCSGSTYGNGTTGGSSSHTHDTSKLYAAISMNENGLFYHYPSGVSYNPNWKMIPSSLSSWAAVSDTAKSDPTSLTGSLGSTSSLPPYIAVTVWKRIA